MKRRKAPFYACYAVPLYPCRLYVAFGETLDDAIKVLPSACDNMFQDEDLKRHASALTTSCRRGVVAVVFVNSCYNCTRLGHEVTHIGGSIMQYVCMGPMTRDNEEAYAYLNGWVARHIHEAWMKCHPAKGRKRKQQVKEST